LDAVVEDLTQRSWIRIEEDSSLILTEEARERFAEIANTQDKVRKAVMKGLSQEEYITVTRILQKMVDNLRL
jgi:DNA-binding MarR family transcriptional regulator